MARTKKEKTEETEDRKTVEEKIESTEKSEKETKEKKKAKLLELAKKLEEKVSEGKEIKTEEIKKKVKEKEGEEKKDGLVSMEDYLKASIHLGTKVITPDMRRYVYRRRADGLAVFNTALLDDMIRQGAEFLSEFAPKDTIIVCKREAGWKAVKKFSEITGIRAFTKKYPAGILTNTTLSNFLETNMIFICDPWLDKNALEDANRIRIPVLSICDTNNFTKGVTRIIPGNNKSSKSIGMILYLLAKLYVEKHKIDAAPFTINDFVDDWDKATIPQ